MSISKKSGSSDAGIVYCVKPGDLPPIFVSMALGACPYTDKISLADGFTFNAMDPSVLSQSNATAIGVRMTPPGPVNAAGMQQGGCKLYFSNSGYNFP